MLSCFLLNGSRKFIEFQFQAQFCFSNNPNDLYPYEIPYQPRFLSNFPEWWNFLGFFFFLGKFLVINDLSDFMLSMAFNMACLCYLCMEWLIICDYWEPNHWQMKNIIKTSTFEMILVEIKATLSKRESCVDLSKI